MENQNSNMENNKSGIKNKLKSPIFITILVLLLSSCCCCRGIGMFSGNKEDNESSSILESSNESSVTETMEEVTEEPTTERSTEKQTSKPETEPETYAPTEKTTTTIATTQNSKDIALKSALEIIEYEDGGYSYDELIEILEFEGYSHNDSVYAADNCDADWNQEAVESAEWYLKTENYSQEFLIRLLISEGFTEEQAKYAISKFDLKSEDELNDTAILHFIINLESNCIHIDSNCNAAQQILQENYSEIDILEDDLSSYKDLYWACGKCSKKYRSILPKPE